MFTSTSRHTADESRQLLLELLDFFENGSVGLQLVALDGTILRINRAQRRLFGLVIEGGTVDDGGGDIRRFLADPEDFGRLARRAVEGEAVHGQRMVVRQADGALTTTFVDANARVEVGSPTGVRLVMRPLLEGALPGGSLASDAGVWAGGNVPIDITSFVDQLDDEAARDLLAELEDFFEHAPIAIHLVSPAGLVARSNKKELEMLGYDTEPSQHIGNDVRAAYADKVVVEEFLEALVSGEPVVNYGTYGRTRSGAMVPILVYSSPRMVDGSFANTRCFVFPNAGGERHSEQFGWPSGG